jgi:hypothetical protein
MFRSYDHLQVESIHLNQIDGASLCLQTPATTPLGFIKQLYFNSFLLFNSNYPLHVNF